MPKPAQPVSLPSNPHLFLPDGWDAGWKAAKAALSTSPAAIQFIGDSIVTATSSTDFMTGSWPARIKTALSAIYATYGEFHAAVYSPTSGYTGSASSNPAFQTTATANIVYATGSGLSSIAALNGAVAFGSTGDLLYTSPAACTALDLIVYDVIAGTFQFNVDGGINGSVSISSGYAAPSAGASTWTVTMQGWATSVRISITGLTSGVHTIRVGGASAQNAGWIEGVTYYTGNAGGILYCHNGQGGSGAQTIVTSGRFPQMAGKYKTSSGDTTHPTGFGFPTGAHLNCYGIGINDCTSLVALDSYINCIRKSIEGWRRARDGCSILLVADCNPDADFTDVTSGFGNPQDWPRFIAAMYALARAYNCGLANVHSRWGETPFGKGLIQATGGHPTDAGYADMATFIGSVL